MTSLTTVLSQLEVVPVETVINTFPPEQNRNLETLTRAEGKGDLLEVLTLGGSLPVASACTCACYGCCSGCCSCSCVSCTCSCACVA